MQIQSPRGVLVADAKGQTLFAGGELRNDALAAAIVNAWRRAGHAVPGVLAVDFGSRSVPVVIVSCAELSVFVAIDPESDALMSFLLTVPFASDVLRHLLTSAFEGMTVVDRQGIVRYISPIHERFFGLRTGEGIGRHASAVIENTRLPEVAATGRAEIGEVQHMRGTTRVVNRIPVFREDGTVAGAIGQLMRTTMRANASRAPARRQEQAPVQVQPGRELAGIVGSSRAIQELKAEIAKVAPLNVPVLLVGESGTGKELAAHAIHRLSRRRDEPMVLVNAAALPHSLVESELFGYEPGSFTGAERKGRKGKFELAHQGTLFIDELGDMPVEVQAKLLRVLQDGTFARLGGDRTLVSDFRLVCASHRDFEQMISDGEFRLDLFYRVSTVTIRLPALRERLEDIEEIGEHAIAAFSRRHRVPPKHLAKDAVDYLRDHPWPGNVRQLVHAIDRAMVLCDGDVITAGDFRATKPGELEPVPRGTGRVRQALRQVEGSLILEAMRRHRGNKKKAADELGISRTYLYKRLAQLN